VASEASGTPTNNDLSEAFADGVLVLASALQLGRQVLWSEDLNPAQVYEQLSVVNPFAYNTG
jgi:predicted nucleic acid-binding protein